MHCGNRKLDCPNHVRHIVGNEPVPPLTSVNRLDRRVHDAVLYKLS